MELIPVLSFAGMMIWFGVPCQRSEVGWGRDRRCLTSLVIGPMVRSEMPKGWPSMAGFVPAIDDAVALVRGWGGFPAWVESGYTGA
ncbi:hypothetical protein TH9_20850 [Thalassospira xiamenensis]|nr:hypothetical protein TH9_20850 [Thalassospira xiamenensis]